MVKWGHLLVKYSIAFSSFKTPFTHTCARTCACARACAHPEFSCGLVWKHFDTFLYRAKEISVGHMNSATNAFLSSVIVALKEP